MRVTFLSRAMRAVRFAGLTALAIPLAACSLTVGSGARTSDERDTGPFTAIEMASAIDLEIEVGPETSVLVEGDDNVVDFIETTVRNDRLVIETESGRRFTTSGPLVVKVTSPRVDEVDLNGSGSANIRGVDAETLSLVLSGSGSLTAEGTVKQLMIDAVGSGSVDTTQLEATDARVDLSGSGSVVLAANGALDADVSGSGSVEYIGEPTVSSDISGSGSLDPAS